MAKRTPHTMSTMSKLQVVQCAVSQHKRMWNKDGRTNASRAHTVPPTREMKMPKPGTDIATMATASTVIPRTAFARSTCK